MTSSPRSAVLRITGFEKLVGGLAIATLALGSALAVPIAASATELSPSSTAVVLADKTFTKYPTPTISGTSAVGGKLTAAHGTWSPAPTTYAYQWSVAGVVAAGATASTYVPTEADYGKTVTVKVTGSRSGYVTKTSAASKATSAVAKGTLVAAVPVISGTLRVDGVLAVTVGTWGAGTVTTTVQWLRNGVAISGATAPTYTLTGADYNLPISVKVTGTSTGPYATSSKTSVATGKVAAGTLTASVPTITGSGEVAGVLTAVPGAWTPAPVTLKYQWLLDGTAISGATAATYTPLTTQVGKTLNVQVTASKTGYTTVSALSAGVPVTVAHFTGLAPVISGLVQAYATLTASPGAVAPLSGTTLSYQWLRDTGAGPVAIVGATATTYVETATDVGATLGVRVTASRTAYATVTADSAPTVAVLDAVTPGKPRIIIDVSFPKRLAADPGTTGWEPDLLTSVSYTWIRHTPGKPDAVAGTGGFYNEVATDKGSTFTLQVTGSAPGYASTTVETAPTAVIK